MTFLGNDLVRRIVRKKWDKMTKNEKRIYKETGDQLKARDIIIRRRWIIFLVIWAVIVTLLYLWIVVFYFAGVIVFIMGFMWLIDWLCGEDVHPDGAKRPDGDQEPSQEEQTMWDIFTLDQFMHHDK